MHSIGLGYRAGLGYSARLSRSGASMHERMLLRIDTGQRGPTLPGPDAPGGKSETPPPSPGAPSSPFVTKKHREKKRTKRKERIYISLDLYFKNHRI